MELFQIEFIKSMGNSRKIYPGAEQPPLGASVFYWNGYEHNTFTETFNTTNVVFSKESDHLKFDGGIISSDGSIFIDTVANLQAKAYKYLYIVYEVISHVSGNFDMSISQEGGAFNNNNIISNVAKTTTKGTTNTFSTEPVLSGVHIQIVVSGFQGIVKIYGIYLTQ